MIDTRGISNDDLVKHFKGNMYKVAGFATHSETMEDMVIYEPLYNNSGLWVRPKRMWNEVVDEKGTLRFTLVD